MKVEKKMIAVKLPLEIIEKYKKQAKKQNRSTHYIMCVVLTKGAK